MKLRNILVFLAVALTGCVGLEQYPTTSYSDDTFWDYEDNCMTALYLGYNQCWSASYYFNNNLLSDDTYGSRNSSDQLEIATGTANTSNGRFSGEWSDCYQELRTIHTALEAESRMNLENDVKSRLVAELRLMRAFTYLRLVTWYGDVPFITSNPTVVEARTLSRTAAATIKEFIHSELEEVAEILPKNTEIPTSENGRYTCGTAVALNARAYLLDNDFENCAIWCDKLINSTDYGTYALESDFAALFHDQDCAHGSESIMTVEYATLDGINNIVRGWSGGGWLPQSIGDQGVTTQSPTQQLVNAFRKLDGSEADEMDYDGRDLRFYTTIAYNGCTVEIPEAMGLAIKGSEGTGLGTYTCWTYQADQDNANDAALFDAYNGTQDRTATGYYSLKNYNADMIDSSGKTYKSIMEIRFADVLLMYAESMFEIGKMTSSVWDITIKPLRERAGFDSSYCAYDSNVNRETIHEERRCELALEGRRAFDIRRWAVLENSSVTSTGTQILTSQALGASFDGENIVCMNPYSMKYWFAIPQGERDINSNLTQNPGW